MTGFLRLALPALAGLVLLAACAQEAPAPLSSPPPTPPLGAEAATGAEVPSQMPALAAPTTPVANEPAGSGAGAPVVGATPPAESMDLMPPPQAPSAPVANATTLPDAGAPDTARGAGGILFTATVHFATGTRDVIEVAIRDVEAADRIELMAPDGSITAAHVLDHAHLRAIGSSASPSRFSLAVTGGSSSKVEPSIGIDFPIFGRSPVSPAREEVLSTALIRVADMTTYRDSWRHWIVRIFFGENGPSPRKMEIVAPAPPPVPQPLAPAG